MRRIGIRELRQNASQYIRLVKQGETIEVTERGEPVALLTPFEDAPTPKSRRQTLIEAGLLIPATADWRDFTPLEPVPGEKPLSLILQEMREEERA